MLSDTLDRPTGGRATRDRTSGIVLALLVQASFLLLVLMTPSRLVPRAPEHEAILVLPPLAPPKPPITIDARAPSTLSTAPPIVPPLPAAPPVMIAPLAPPGGLAGFGRSLFGCAPEHYADLPPDERAHCPKPGEGMAKRNDNDLATTPRSHAKDEDMWQQQFAEDHDVPPICPPGDGPGAVAKCMMHDSMAQNRQASAAWARIEERRARERAPKPPPVPNIGVRRGY